ncbi:hypothetical protein [Marinobacter confluentis]|uniref:Uncharacterized protein n=1 Tax=Marinobacter confluentis TaxID=1697557 RepID=A0A4Z1C0H7_9GAMM|nr:hypothetical protein [Marinobacter confluentis]TGN38308.1 hypothetical protein E5Q11_15880 [Marinobacter confluentis]
MSTMASERSWLLNPGLLKLVHQCRRLIQSEFGVKLHLTEDHLERRLAEFAGKTRSSHLMKTWETLAPQIPHLEMPRAEETGSDGSNQGRPRRMYRGQPVADPEPPTPVSDGESAPTRRKTIIYRGQVVEH